METNHDDLGRRYPKAIMGDPDGQIKHGMVRAKENPAEAGLPAYYAAMLVPSCEQRVWI